MPNQVAVHYYDEDGLAEVRRVIDNLTGIDYSEFRTHFQWSSQNGKVRAYPEIDDTHLLNILAVFTKRANKDFEGKPDLKAKQTYSTGLYCIQLSNWNALLLVEAFYRGIIDMQMGPIDLIILKEVFMRIVKHARSYYYETPLGVDNIAPLES